MSFENLNRFYVWLMCGFIFLSGTFSNSSFAAEKLSCEPKYSQELAGSLGFSTISSFFSDKIFVTTSDQGFQKTVGTITKAFWSIGPVFYLYDEQGELLASSREDVFGSIYFYDSCKQVIASVTPLRLTNFSKKILGASDREWGIYNYKRKYVGRISNLFLEKDIIHIVNAEENEIATFARVVKGDSVRSDAWQLKITRALPVDNRVFVMLAAFKIYKLKRTEKR